MARAIIRVTWAGDGNPTPGQPARNAANINETREILTGSRSGAGTGPFQKVNRAVSLYEIPPAPAGQPEPNIGAVASRLIRMLNHFANPVANGNQGAYVSSAAIMIWSTPPGVAEIDEGSDAPPVEIVDLDAFTASQAAVQDEMTVVKSLLEDESNVNHGGTGAA